MTIEASTEERLIPPKKYLSGLADQSKKSDLPALTSLRFLAVTLVLLAHFSAIFDIGVDFVKDIAVWQGVTCFFVLSGFILAYVHPKLHGTVQKDKYLIARIARIWPTHCASLLFFVLICPISLAIPNVVLTTALNITMTHAWTLYRPIYNAFNTPSWSLSVEFFFYLCFPFLIDRIQTTWKWKLLGATFLSLMCVALTMWSFYPFFPPFGNSIPPLINVNPLCRLFEFVVGIVTYVAFDRFHNTIKLSRLQATLWELFAFALVFASIELPRLWVLNDTSRFFEAFRSWISTGGCAPFFGLLVFLMAMQKGAISQFLCLKPMVHCGKLSYSMYLYHYAVLLFWASQPYFMNVLPRVVLVCIALASVFLVSELNLRLVETPFRKWILALYKRSTRTA